MNANNYPDESKWPVPSGFCVSVMNAIESGVSAKEAFKLCSEKEKKVDLSYDEPEAWD